MKKDAAYLRAKKNHQQKIVALTGYDYPTAVLEDQAGVDVIFVGDSVGTNVLGYASEAEVTLEDIAHHLRAVHRGVSQAYILADLPFGTYDQPEQALENARYLRSQGADIVKLEGYHPEVVEALVAAGIPLCGHLGLLPQTHVKKAVQGKQFEQARQLIEEARLLEQLGCQLLVLELVPEELAQMITKQIQIPTIGIGAGRYVDGQVLIVNDILGITPRKLRLAIKYQNFQGLIAESIERYHQDVDSGSFPSEDNVRHMATAELEKLRDWLG